MDKEFNYISDEALEQLINQVEQKELVAAPPDLMERILEAAGATKEIVPQPAPVIPVKRETKKEFYAYCIRVITSVAAALALIFLLPELSGRIKQTAPEIGNQEVPDWEDVVDVVPSRDEVVMAVLIPTKEEVLDDTGFIKRVLDNTGWFNKKNSEK